MFVCMKISRFVTTKFTLISSIVKPGFYIVVTGCCQNVADGLSLSFEFLGLRQSMPVVGCLSGSLIVFHGR